MMVYGQHGRSGVGHKTARLLHARIGLGGLFVGMGRKMQQVRSSRARASALMSHVPILHRVFSAKNHTFLTVGKKLPTIWRVLARNLLNTTGTKSNLDRGSTICGGS